MNLILAPPIVIGIPPTRIHLYRTLNQTLGVTPWQYEAIQTKILVSLFSQLERDPETLSFLSWLNRLPKETFPEMDWKHRSDEKVLTISQALKLFGGLMREELMNTHLLIPHESHPFHYEVLQFYPTYLILRRK